MNATSNPTPDSIAAGMTGDDFDALDDILDDLRTRYDETPQWEFCEGFMAALICCRRADPAQRIPAGAAGHGAATRKNPPVPSPTKPSSPAS